MHLSQCQHIMERKKTKMIKILGTPKRLHIECDFDVYQVVCEHDSYSTLWFRGSYEECLKYIRSKEARIDYGILLLGRNGLE